MWLYIFVSLVVAFLGWWVLSLRRPAKAPPIVDGATVPFFGAAFKMANPVEYVTKMRNKHGAVWSIKNFGQTLTYLNDPESQTVFFKARDDELSSKEAYKFVTPIFGNGIVYDATPEVMVEQIKFVRGSLTAEKLKSYVPKMIAECEAFFAKYAPKVGETTKIDMIAAMADLTILTASRCLLGDHIRQHMGERVAALYHDFDAALTIIAFFAPNLPFVPAFKKRDAARLEMNKIFNGEMKRRRESQTPEQYSDLLELLMSSQYKDGTDVSDEHIAGILIGTLFAGQHTSSITATWTGLLLHANPAYLKRVIDEQKEVLAETDGRLTFEGLKKMVVLENAVKETLRMYPPLIFLMRKALQDIPCKEYIIPKGDLVFVSPAVGHRNPDVYPNPDVWDPDRFAEPRMEHTKQSYGWFGFGGGRHGCIGEMFGIQQVKTVWSILLRDFKWEEASVPPPDFQALIVGPTPPVIRSITRTHLSHAS